MKSSKFPNSSPARRSIKGRQKKAGAARSSDAQRYRTLFDNMPEGFALHEIITDSQGKPYDYRFLAINPSFELLTGLTRAEVLGKRVLEVLPGVEPYWIENYGKVALTGEPVHFENFAAALNRWYGVFVYRPAPLQFAVIFSDITERKLAEAELRRYQEHLEELVKARTSELESKNDRLATEIADCRQAEDALRQGEQRLNRAQEISHLGSWELDFVLNRLSWSDEVYRIFGLQPREFGATYEAFLAAVHPDDRAAVDAAYSGSLHEGRDAYEIEHRVVRKSTGEVRIVHEKCEHVRDKSGRIIHSVGMVHDITEQKRAEGALRTANERLVLAQQSAGAGIWDWDMVTGKLDWSPELFRLFRLDPATAEATFDSWRSVIHPEDRQVAEERIERAIQNRAPLDSEYRIVLPTGETRWISALGNTTYDGSGKPERMSGICIDITGAGWRRRNSGDPTRIWSNMLMSLRTISRSR